MQHNSSKFKKSRNGEDIKREITALIREMKDPRISGALLTVVSVDLASDLSFGKVYISSLNGFEAADVACRQLSLTAGHIRRELADRLRLRKPPELRFIPDDTVRKSFEMFEKIKTSSPAPDSEVSE